VTVEQLVDNMVANCGDIESAHAVFLYDAARQRGLEKRVGDYLAANAEFRMQNAEAAAAVPSAFSIQHSAFAEPVYHYAKDLGAYLKSHAVARRLGDARIIAAAWENLQHGPSLEAFSFA
jgi:hypothetical protein